MYTLRCFALDGDSITEGKFKTIEEAWKRSEDMGSRWIFYPIHTVATDTTIVDAGYFLDFMKRKRIKTFSQFVKDNTEFIESLF